MLFKNHLIQFEVLNKALKLILYPYSMHITFVTHVKKETKDGVLFWLGK